MRDRRKTVFARALLIIAFLLISQQTLQIATAQPQRGTTQLQNVAPKEANTTIWDTNQTLPSDYTIVAGTTLIIMPGITVKIEEDVSIIVKGILKANGTEENPITFTHNDAGEYWGAIKFTDQCIDTECIIKYCNIWYGGFSYGDYGGIWCQQSSPTIVNSNFSYNHMSGVWSTGSPTITNNSFFNTGGIYAGGSPLISYNTILENFRGIDISYSGARITDNVISNNTYGLYCWGANNPFICSASIINNTIVNNTYGIWLGYSWGGTQIQNNTLKNNGEGIYFYFDVQNVYVTNTVVESSAGAGIYLCGATNNIIDCHIRNNTYGILFPPLASGNNIQGCTLSDNVHGVYIDTKGAAEPKIWHNTLIGNSILHSEGYGIYLPRGDGYSVGFFSIHHNNFVNNTQNAFDDSADTYWDSNGEGNHWDNYNGYDNNSDGIGDASYIIDSDSQDNFPLMEPFGRPVLIVSTNQPLCINETAIFDATQTQDTRGIFIQYSWDFNAGDGISIDAEGTLVNTIYIVPGNYIVTLSIIDLFGYRLIKEINITVGIRNIELSKTIILESVEDKIKISTTINNTGTLDVKSIDVYFYAGIQIIGSKVLDIPTNTSTTTFIFWKAQVGFYTLDVVTDPNNAVFEVDETDNAAFLSLNLTDLSISPENVTITDTDEGVQITVGVWNYGPIENNAEVAIYRGTELILNLSGIIGSNSSTTFIGLTNLLGGAHNISIIADPKNKILETNKNNNIISTTTIVTGLPDLCVLSSDIIFDPYPPIEAANATTNITIRNIGYSYSSLAQLRAHDRTLLLGDFLISSLAPNGQVTISVNFTVCRDSEIRVEIEPYGNEYNPNNNYCTKTTNITLVSDLSITADNITFYPSQNLTEGQTALVYARIRNIGSLPSDEARVIFYDNDVIINEIPITALAGYSTAVVWTEFQAKSGHAITVKIISLTDANTENNLAAKTIFKTLAADISIISADIVFEAVPQPIENRSTVISATIRNYGDGASEIALISFFAESTLIDAVEVAQIEPNASRKVWVVWNNAKEGQTITVRINTTAFDNNTANNEASIILEKTLKPDLIVSAIKTEPGYPKVDQKAILYAQITNIGDGASDAALITFYDNGEVINTARIGSVLPNQTLIAWTEWVAKPGHTISVTIQSENYELNTTNNQFSVEIAVYVESPFSFIAIIGLISASALIIYFFTETGKWKFVTLTIPLYTKLKEKDLFAVEKRVVVYDYVQANPGAHLNSIIRGVNMSGGIVIHHLQKLEEFGKVHSVNKRFYRYYWPKKVWEEEVWKEDWIRRELTKLEAEIYNIVKDRPGTSQQEIVNEIGKSQSTVSYHLDKLKKRNIITTKQVGKETRYYVVPKEA